MDNFTAVSLFAGIGGFDLALRNNGVEVVASVEIDKHARGVLEKQFPTTQHLEDVKEVTSEQLIRAGFTPDNGIITGGFPCQDLSVAGLRRGLVGVRSGLFYEVARILEETKSKYFILENVPGLLTSNGGRDMGAVINTLVKLGYGLSWRVLDSQYFGLPQRRKRVFIVGVLGDHGRISSEILDLPEGRLRYLTEGNESRERITRMASKGITETDFIGGELVGSLMASDYKFPQQQQVMENKIVLVKSRRARNTEDYETWKESPVSPTLNLGDNAASTRATVLIFEESRRDGIRGPSEIAPTLQGFMGTGGGNVPMLRAIQGNVIGRSDTAGPQGKGFSEEAGPMFTLTKSDIHAIGTESFIRRITPKECERLQGFPDDWTAGQSDTQRYKQTGNAVSVPVADWVIKRLLNVN